MHQLYIYIYAEAETPIIWLPDGKNWLTGKDPDAGKDWRQEKGMTEDEMVGWPHWLDEHEFEQALGDGDGRGSLACCSPWGRKESYTTETLNWTDIPSFLDFLPISVKHWVEFPVLYSRFSLVINVYFK